MRNVLRFGRSRSSSIEDDERHLVSNGHNDRGGGGGGGGGALNGGGIFRGLATSSDQFSSDPEAGLEDALAGDRGAKDRWAKDGGRGRDLGADEMAELDELLDAREHNGAPGSDAGGGSDGVRLDRGNRAAPGKAGKKVAKMKR